MSESHISEINKSAENDGEWEEKDHAELFCRLRGFGLQITHIG